MSTTTQMELSHVMYTPSDDAQVRQRTVVSKHRRSLSTGGGRAWSESEETYLLQTRSQKMPYKHIAAHLNKTELACRLHYHQISHGSNRRKRNLSCSSISTDYSHLFRENSIGTDSRMSPASQVEVIERGTSVSPNAGVRLPSIMSTTTSPKLPAILPKPDERERGYPEGQRALPAWGEAPPHAHPHSHAQAHRQPLKLDTAFPSVSTHSHNVNHIDLARLQAIYAAHRNTFWAAVANDYGHNVQSSVLERAWKSGRCCSGQQQGGHSPMTPSASPTSDTREGFGSRTSISSILGPDAGGFRSAWDRDMIRKMEVN